MSETIRRILINFYIGGLYLANELPIWMEMLNFLKMQKDLNDSVRTSCSFKEGKNLWIKTNSQANIAKEGYDWLAPSIKRATATSWETGIDRSYWRCRYILDS